MNKTDALIWLDYRTRPLAKVGAGNRLRHFVRERLAQRGDLMVRGPDGLRVFGDVGDREYLAAVASGRIEALNMRLFLRAIANATAVVDVGAHIGRYAIVAASHLCQSPRTCVWAFEPNPLSYRLLRKNQHENGLLQPLSISPVALSDRAGTAVFHLSPGDRSTSSLYKGTDHDGDVTVITARLDDVVPEDVRVDVLKMDVEGGEVRALRGMPRVLSQLDHLFVECNPSALSAAGSSADELLSLLTDAGYDPRVVDERERRLRPIVPGDTTSGYVNLYATGPER